MFMYIYASIVIYDRGGKNGVCLVAWQEVSGSITMSLPNIAES